MKNKKLFFKTLMNDKEKRFFKKYLSEIKLEDKDFFNFGR